MQCHLFPKEQKHLWFLRLHPEPCSTCVQAWVTATGNSALGGGMVAHACDSAKPRAWLSTLSTHVWVPSSRHLLRFPQTACLWGGPPGACGARAPQLPPDLRGHRRPIPQLGNPTALGLSLRTRAALHKALCCPFQSSCLCVGVYYPWDGWQDLKSYPTMPPYVAFMPFTKIMLLRRMGLG